MKIAELKPGQGDVELEANVVKIDGPTAVNTKFGTKVNLTKATLEDDTDRIELAIWGDDHEVEEGTKVKVTKAYVKEFRGDKQLSLGKEGTIEQVE